MCTNYGNYNNQMYNNNAHKACSSIMWLAKQNYLTDLELAPYCILRNIEWKIMTKIKIYT